MTYARDIPASQGNQNGDETLRMYALLRGDLQMSPGKMAAMAGHCFTNTILTALEHDPQLVSAYQGPENIGTKICLNAKHLHQVLRAYEEAQEANIPCALIIDQGHIHLPNFDGNPIIVGAGFGPITRSQADFLKRFNCI